MIKTKEFKPSKIELIQVSIKAFIKLRWWVFVILFIVLNYNLLISGITELAITLIIYIVTILICIVLLYWLQYSSKKNKMYFKKKYFEINDEYLKSFNEDGGEHKVMLDNIVKLHKSVNYYALFISTTYFIYLPKSIFYSDEDILAFESILKNKHILK